MAAAVSDQSILNLRRRFADECRKLENLPHDSDIARVEKDDTYLRNFLLHVQGDEDEAFQMLLDCVAWRKTFGVHTLSARSLDEEIIRTGICYMHGRDVDGNPICVVNIRLHKKDPERLPRLKQLFVYLLEEQRSREPDGLVTVVFDMSDAGLSNMDMDLVRFVIDCFKFYFPNMLNVLLVFEMPFVLSAVWRIVKGWLSERAQAKIKFVKRGNVNQYISAAELQTPMGGSDTWTFDGDEFYRLHSPPELRMFESVAPDDGDEGDVGVESDGASPSLRRVHFAEDVDPPEAGTTPDRQPARGQANGLNSVDSTTASQTQQQRQAHVHSMLQHQSSKDVAGGSLRRRVVSTAGLMEISPSDVVEFRARGTEEVAVPLTLQNISTHTIGYKVKTTGPDRYHVKPSAGVVPTGASAVATVTIRAGFDKSMVSHDKFLVEYCPVPPALPASELPKFWKNLDRSAMQEKILRTRLSKPRPPSPIRESPTGDEHPASSSSSASTALLQKSVADLSAKVASMEQKQRHMLRRVERVTDLAYVFVTVLFVLLLAAVAHFMKIWRVDVWL